jgi:hypothetical protein
MEKMLKDKQHPLIRYAPEEDLFDLHLHSRNHVLEDLIELLMKDAEGLARSVTILSEHLLSKLGSEIPDVMTGDIKKWLSTLGSEIPDNVKDDIKKALEASRENLTQVDKALANVTNVEAMHTAIGTLQGSAWNELGQFFEDTRTAMASLKPKTEMLKRHDPARFLVTEVTIWADMVQILPVKGEKRADFFNRMKDFAAKQRFIADNGRGNSVPAPKTWPSEIRHQTQGAVKAVQGAVRALTKSHK